MLHSKKHQIVEEMIELDKLVHHVCIHQRTAEEFSGVLESKCQVQEEAVLARETAVSAIPPVKLSSTPQNETARTETPELLISLARRNETAREEILEVLKL